MVIAKGVYRIQFLDVNSTSGQFYFANFECGYASLEALAVALNEGDIVLGNKLVTRRAVEPGMLEVVDRFPIGVRREGIARIETPTVRFIEYEDGAAS